MAIELSEGKTRQGVMATVRNGTHHSWTFLTYYLANNNHHQYLYIGHFIIPIYSMQFHIILTNRTFKKYD